MVALQWDSSLEEMLLGKVESRDVQLNHIFICQIGELNICKDNNLNKLYFKSDAS